MISVINATKNRNGIHQAVKSWIPFDEIDEIIIVDWDSDVPIEPTHEKVTVFRIENKPFFCISHAFNLAAHLANGDLLLKLDADYELRSNFFTGNPLPIEGVQFCKCDTKKRRTKNEKYLNGLMFLAAEDFWKIGGYHEGLTQYGYDDIDLRERLKEIGKLSIAEIDFDTVYHIPHEATLRFQYNKDAYKTREQRRAENRSIAKRHRWTSEDAHWYDLESPTLQVKSYINGRVVYS
jgi:hypothetical protein